MEQAFFKVGVPVGSPSGWKLGRDFSPPESGGRGVVPKQHSKVYFGTTPRTISTSSRSCCPP